MTADQNKVRATRFFQVPPDGQIRPLASAEEARQSLTAGGYIWLDFVDPSLEELSAWQQPLGLHPLSIEDCLDDNQVPKIDDFPTHTFVLFNSYEYKEKKLSVREINFFLGKNFLISVTHGHSRECCFFNQLEEYIRQDLANVRQGPDFLLHVILDYVVDEKFKAIESLQDELDEMEEVIIQDPGSFKPETLLHLRKHLLSLRKSLFHEREVLTRICRRDSPYVQEKAIYHFRDIYDHLAKFYEVIEIYREMISNHMEVYLSMLNNRMTQVANRTNRIVRRLTLINTIFMPLTLLAGIGGMSEWSMMTGPGNWKVAYPIFLGGMLVLAFLSYFILKRFEAKDKDQDY